MKMLRINHHPNHASTGFSTSPGSSSWITDNTGRPIQHLHYLPYGEDWVDQRNSSWSAPYTFSGKEKDVETGYGYFGARYYDSGLSIWLSVDPMSDKYPSMSPYNYCANNPVILVDPDGRDFYDENAVFLGKSNDNNVYVVANASEQEKIRANEAEKKTTDPSTVPGAIKLPSQSIRQEMVDVLRQEDGKNSFQEYCGYFGQTSSNTDKINWGNPGGEVDPCIADEAQCYSLMCANPDDVGKITKVEGEFHSHASGIKTCGVNEYNYSSYSINKTLQKGFNQTPSEADYKLAAGQQSFIPMHYEVALGSVSNGGQRVYMYNKDGFKASFPLEAFRNLKR